MLIDACSIINLFNCGYLAAVSMLVDLRVSPIVLGECGPACAAEVIALAAQGRIHFVGDEEIDPDRFLDLVSNNNIGEGELESIVVCELTGEELCSDDGSARSLARVLLGADKVCGSLRLLRRAVELDVLSCDLAFGGYQDMVAHGAWLPAIPHEYFAK